MPRLGTHPTPTSTRKKPFACPECGVGLLVDSEQPVDGTCPSCGGWISSPKPLSPMPVTVRITPEKATRRQRPRFQAHGGRVAADQYRCGVSPDVILDSGYETRKEMRGFYRFLGAMAVAAGLCLAVIFFANR